ncbi:thiamine pyrophosphate-binding protein [Roseisalinus antarcticus]|uniref:Acetolactate synthase isozyme 2 large subunit n=1 Tax=Roseisalinus antarcticus TaxID=254357 RepID=A0A1Y5SMH1_9RHOB|nr:thiamine pyrophosphate-binding protein [Roseisalinus antarcticus]SLN44169.1 Acetolactate synthase isozyme 2 large subunit [Roseisalinus antarcticus]
MRHGGKILADQLHKLGVRRVFSVPGESFLAALDGLYESGIENIVCRQEGGAAMMAEAQGKMSGAPGVCFVTRGPGATNASAGIHIARQDSTPMVMFVGQIDRGHRDRGAFQEVDYRAMFGGLAKWVAEIDRTDRLPEYIARAFRVALSGRPGPVVLALPEDMLSDSADVADYDGLVGVYPTPAPAAFDAIMAKLAEAERPLVVVGGPHWSPRAEADLKRFLEVQGLPAVADFRRQSYLDNRHRSYAGDLNVGMAPALAARVREADCLLLLGSRLGDIETRGYTLVDPAAPAPTILQVHPDADEIGQVYGPAAAVVATAPDALEVLAGRARLCGREDWTAAARADYEAWRRPHPTPGDVKMEEIVHWLSDSLPEDAILTNGAGNYAAWLHRYFVFKGPGTQLAPTSGSMGYGFPAAVSAALQHPERVVVCMAGDGCFQMTLNEMSTAVQHGAAPIVVVCNNGQYGTIRMHQERHYPGRVSGTALANPDFAALARAYGGHGELVTRSEDFADAFARARAAGVLAVIELRVDPEALSTGATLTELRGS